MTCELFLLSEGITQDNLNDDVAGRTPDAIAASGPAGLFNEIVASCLLPTDFGSKGGRRRKQVTNPNKELGEGFTIAGERLRKILHLTESVRNVGE